MKSTLSEFNSNRTINLTFRMSLEKTDSGHYYSTSVFISFYKYARLLTATVVGSSGDFKSYLIGDISKGELSYYTSNGNLANKTIVCKVELSK